MELRTKKIIVWSVVGILVVACTISWYIGKSDWAIVFIGIAISLFWVSFVPLNRWGYTEPIFATDTQKKQVATYNKNVINKKIPNKSVFIFGALIITAIILLILKHEFLGGMLLFFTPVGFGLYINNLMTKQ